MSRFGSLILCATLGAGLLGCGNKATSPKDPVSFVPLDNAVSGWTVDSAHNKNGSAQPMTATTKEQAEGLIDGAAAPFYKVYTPKEFVWQNYVNGSLPAAPPDPNANPEGATVVLYIWEMPSADQAGAIYTALLQESEYAGNWQSTSPTLGSESRIEDTITKWWINFHQDVFYVEVFFSPSFGPAPDYTPSDPDLKNEAMRFAQAVAAKI